MEGSSSQKITISHHDWTLLLTLEMYAQRRFRVRSESERLKGSVVVYTEREKLLERYGVFKNSSLASFKKDFEEADMLCKNVTEHVCYSLDDLELQALAARVREMRQLYTMIIDILTRKLLSKQQECKYSDSTRSIESQLCPDCRYYKYYSRLQKIRHGLQRNSTKLQLDTDDTRQVDPVQEAQLESAIETTLQKKPKVLRVSSAHLSEFLQSILNDQPDASFLKKFERKDRDIAIEFLKESNEAMNRIFLEMGEAFTEIKLTKIVPCILSLMTDYHTYKQKVYREALEVKHQSMQTLPFVPSRLLEIKLKEVEYNLQMKGEIIGLLEADCSKLKQYLSEIKENTPQLSYTAEKRNYRVSGRNPRNKSRAQSKTRSKTLQKEMPRLTSTSKSIVDPTSPNSIEEAGTLPRLTKSKSNVQERFEPLPQIERPSAATRYISPINKGKPANNRQQSKMTKISKQAFPLQAPLDFSNKPQGSSLSSSEEDSGIYYRKTINIEPVLRHWRASRRATSVEPIGSSAVKTDGYDDAGPNTLKYVTEVFNNRGYPQPIKLVSFLEDIKETPAVMPRQSVFTKTSLKKQRINKRMMFKKQSLFSKDDLYRLFFSLPYAQYFESTVRSADSASNTYDCFSYYLQNVYKYILSLKQHNLQAYTSVVGFLLEPYTSSTSNLSSARKSSDLSFGEFNATMRQLMSVHAGCNKQGAFCSHIQELLDRIRYFQRESTEQLHL